MMDPQTKIATLEAKVQRLEKANKIYAKQVELLLLKYHNLLDKIKSKKVDKKG